MSNKIKDISIKNHTYYFFDDVINVKNFDPNVIKIDGNSQKNILNYYNGHATTKDQKYVKINSQNPVYYYFQQSKWIF